MFLKEYIKKNYKNFRWFYKNEFIFLFNKLVWSNIFKLGFFNKSLINTAKNFSVNNICIGHFHFDFNFKVSKYLNLKIFETYTKNSKVYKFLDGYLVTDVHLGFNKYKKKELSNLYEILKSNKKVYILGDLTEKYLIWNDYNIYEKDIINLVISGVKSGNVIRIKGNHDDLKYERYMQDFYIIDDYLLIHGDFLI